MRAYARSGRPRQVYRHHLRPPHIVGSPQQLLDQLAAALAHGHRSQCAVAGVAVAAQNHAAADSHRFPVIAVNIGQVRRHVDAAVFPGGGQGELVIVLIDGAAYRTKAVVAVGQHIRHGKMGHAGSPCRLNDTHRGDIVTGHAVEFQPQRRHIVTGVVRLQNTVADGGLCRLFRRDGAACGLLALARVVKQLLAPVEVHTILIKFNHTLFSVPCWHIGMYCM